MNDKSDIIFENPFSSWYLAEDFVREAGRIIEKGLLSPEMFKFPGLISLVTESMNHFVVGVPGSGKTMALAFLRVECLALIDKKVELKKGFGKIWPQIEQERGLWGIYLGLMMNEELLSPPNFRGSGPTDGEWTKIFGDFINYVYLKHMLKHLCLSIDEPGGDIPKWLGFNKKQDEIKRAIADFAVDLGMPGDRHSPKGLLDWVKERLKLYQKIIKERTKFPIDKSELPGSFFYSEVGYLPIKLVNSLRNSGALEPNQRIFFLLDEYDQCELAERREFAQAINSFVKTTARGFTSNIFVKIGTRPHGFHDKTVWGGKGKIEDGRDYKEINLTILMRWDYRTLFKELVTDIANRRIKSVEWFNKRGINDFKSMLEKIKPDKEADLYLSHQDTKKEEQFKVLLDYCKIFKDKDEKYKYLVSHINGLVPGTLHQKYMIIECCRKLQRMGNTNEENLKIKYESLLKNLEQMANFLNTGGQLKNNSKLYYKLKDLREPALFLLAHDFKRPKYYCGFETIILMSEGVPLNFIKLSQALFDEVSYRLPEFEKNKKIDIKKQNRVIRKVAGEIRKEASAYLCNWQGFQTLLDELGFIFRRMQLNPTAPYPTPNGFSVEEETNWLSSNLQDNCKSVSDNSINYLKKILREALDWGYFTEMPHRSKFGSLKTRTKYYISSMIAPYYDLSVRHLKEPLYTSVEDLRNLCSPDKSIRSKTRGKIMGRIKSLGVKDDLKSKEGKPKNRNLFEGIW
jgi:hypothetical protein